MENAIRESQRRTALIAVLLLVAVLIPFGSLFDYPGNAMDEGMVLLYPELVLKGQVPYRDFETFYGPGNLWTLAGAYAAFGVHINVERSVGLIYRLLLLAGIFVALRRWSLGAAAGGVFIALIFLLPSRLLALAWPGGVACALWSLLVLAGKPGRWRAGAAGLLAAGALLFRPDLGPAMALSSLPLFLALDARRRWHYLAGVVSGLIPLGILALVAGPQATLENLFTYPVILSNPGRRLPLSLAPTGVIFILSLHAGATLCNVLAGALAWKRDRKSVPARLFLALALLGAGLTHAGIQRADFIHAVLTAFFSAALLPVAFPLLLRRGKIQAEPLGMALGAAAAVLLTIGLGEPHLYKLFQGAWYRASTVAARTSPAVTMRDRQFSCHVVNQQVQWVVNFLEKKSLPGERLFVGTVDLRRTYASDTFLYHLLPWLTPATYFLEMNPLSANRPNSRLASDVASADWLVLNHAWDNPQEANLSAFFGSDAPNEVVRRQFELHGRAYPFEVYRRKRAATLAQAGEHR